MNGDKRLYWIIGIGAVAFIMSLIAGSPLLGIICLLLLVPYIVEELRKQKKQQKMQQAKQQEKQPEMQQGKQQEKPEAKKAVANGVIKKGDYDFSETMTSQLVALWISTGDERFRSEYLRRLAICGLDQQTAEDMLKYERSILEKYPRPEMLDRKFIFRPLFDLSRCLLPQHYSYYETHFEYPLSYIVKASDEAEWHFWNSHEKDLSNGVWEEIYALSDKNMKFFGPFAMDLVNNHGWTVGNVNEFSRNEQGMLNIKRWGRAMNQASKDPWNIKSLGI